MRQVAPGTGTDFRTADAALKLNAVKKLLVSRKPPLHLQERQGVDEVEQAAPGLVQTLGMVQPERIQSRQGGQRAELQAKKRGNCYLWFTLLACKPPSRRALSDREQRQGSSEETD